jgi:CRISPR type III-B/RAMP module RAMP protein Cmr6
MALSTMPVLTLLASDTKATLGEGAALCDSRSLLLDRLLEPGSAKGASRNALQMALSRPPLTAKLQSWQELVLHRLPVKVDQLLFGQLQGRLLLKAAGSRRQNSTLCLDRLTGVPYIPGSAIKGCARRMAINQLRETTEYEDKIRRLNEAALVFGWGDRDWNQDSDLAWACGAEWERICPAAQQQLREQLGSGDWQRGLARFKGAVQFLPAYPWELQSPDVELEVLSGHHQAYYRAQAGYSKAPDTEEPKPVFFPVVAPGHVFVFVILGEPIWQAAARRWLQDGLAVFGLGAKTAAGYGWFDTSEPIQKTWQTALNKIQESERALRQQRQEEQLRRLEAEAKQKAEATLKEALAKLTPEEQEDHRLRQLTDDQFRSKLQHFTKALSEEEQFAIVRALRKERQAFWIDLKQRAQRGGPWAQVEQAIRVTAKKCGLGKMP